MTGVETYAGQPVSPLQPGEAKDFAEKLKALPPDAGRRCWRRPGRC
jgi:hypothetical protein